MGRLLNKFQDIAKGRQLYIEMPHICALVYAVSDKPGCYIGNFHNKSVFNKFETEKFIAAHSLAGPASNIICKVAKDGLYGE